MYLLASQLQLPVQLSNRIATPFHPPRVCIFSTYVHKEVPVPNFEDFVMRLLLV